MSQGRVFQIEYAAKAVSNAGYPPPFPSSLYFTHATTVNVLYLA